MDTLLFDHFALHPTGSTTAAIVSILHTHPPSSPLTPMTYVSLISLDFMKAFDCVRHSSFSKQTLCSKPS